MNRRTVSAFSVISCILLLLSTGNAKSLPNFTEKEIKKLEAGDLVKRAVSPKKTGGYRGGRSYILLDDNEDTCYKVMADLKNYYFFYDDTLIEAKVLKSEGNKKLIRMKYGKGPFKMTYHANYVLNKKKHVIKFKLDESLSNDINDAKGYIKFVPYNEEKVLMINATFVDFGEKISFKLFGNKIANGMLKLPKYVKKFLATPQSKKYRVAKK